MRCGSKPAVVDEETKAIDESIRVDGQKKRHEIKILVLGAGESGKSTFLKQMKILNLNGWSVNERKEFKPFLHLNAVETISALIKGAGTLGITLPEEHSAATDEHGVVTEDFAAKIQMVWGLPAIKECYNRRALLQIPSCAGYMMENVSKFADPGYIPTVEDILQCRVRTTGIHELTFEESKFHYRIIDVGGQRSERRKWVHCFNDVTCIIFIVALDSYNLRLYEDESVNRMQEERKLFDEVVNCQWFRATNILLFLNKADLFREKLPTAPLSTCFPDYKGGSDVEGAVDFIKHKFKKLNRVTGRDIFAHVTTATDTENIRKVFEAVKVTLKQKGMQGGSIM